MFNRRGIEIDIVGNTVLLVGFDNRNIVIIGNDLECQPHVGTCRIQQRFTRLHPLFHFGSLFRGDLPREVLRIKNGSRHHADRDQCKPGAQVEELLKHGSKIGG